MNAKPKPTGSNRWFQVPSKVVRLHRNYLVMVAVLGTSAWISTPTEGSVDDHAVHSAAPLADSSERIRSIVGIELSPTVGQLDHGDPMVRGLDPIVQRDAFSDGGYLYYLRP